MTEDDDFENQLLSNPRTFLIMQIGKKVEYATANEDGNTGYRGVLTFKTEEAAKILWDRFKERKPVEGPRTFSEEDVEKVLATGALIIGMNNRDLHTFKIDLGVTQKLVRMLPANKIKVSESGIKSYEDVMFLKSLGVNAVLIGEAFMESSDIAATMRDIMRF